MQQIALLSNGRNEVIEIDPIEVNIVPTNQSERSVAQAKVDSVMLASSRSNSKSPTSSRSHRPMRHGTESPPRTTEREESNSGHSRPKSSKKSSRRPHTSSGPTRESKSIFSSSNVPLPDRSDVRSSFQSPPGGLPSPLFPPTSFRLGLKSSCRPSSGTKHVPADTSLVSDWERELDRVASKSSQRSAQMMRFGRHPVSRPGSSDHGHVSLGPNPVVIVAVPGS